MSDSTKDWLRPSALPKLAMCGSYRSDADAGVYAARGTKLDDLFRRAIAHENISVGELTNDEIIALRWSVDTARALSGKMPLESRESELRIEAEGLEGTADVLCEQGGWSGDLKTGQRRSYLEQQAAYALGFMDRFFSDEWTIYLIYCDLQEVETLRFTRESATVLVRDAIAKALGGEPPTPNEYCGWCARRWECSARREAIGIVPFERGSELKLEDAPSPLLRDFILRANTVDDFAVRAREILKDRILAGNKVPGCSLVSKRGARKVSSRVIELHIKDLGYGDVLSVYGDMSEEKLKEIWARKLPNKPFPESEVQEMPGSSYVRVSRPRLQNP